MNDYHQQLLKRAERTLQGQPVSAFASRIKAIVGPPAATYQGLAAEAIETLRDNGKPTPKQLAALELVIRLMRPAVLTKGGELGPLEPDLALSFPLWDSFRAAAKTLLYSIGRIDLLPQQAVGTGFLVGPNLLVTNKHVLNVLSNGTNLLEEGQAGVRFKYEYGTPDKELVSIVGVVAVHTSLDIALLSLSEKNPESRTPLEIETDETQVSDPVAAVGYPMDDPKRNPLFIGPIFGGKFGVKRVAPGEVIGVESASIHHDCTTLGGNSGSPILSMKTAKVVGLHREGMFLYRNEAINGSSLKQFVQVNLNSQLLK